MGTPDHDISNITRFVISNAAVLEPPTKDDYIVILNASLNIVRRIDKFVRLPKISDDLGDWLVHFKTPSETLDSRGIFVYEEHKPMFGRELYYVGEDATIFRVKSSWGPNADDPEATPEWAPYRTNVSISEFVDVIDATRGSAVNGVIWRIKDGIDRLRIKAEEKVAKLQGMSDELEGIRNRLSAIRPQ